MIRSKLFALSKTLTNTGVRQISTTGPKLGGHGKMFYREFPTAGKEWIFYANCMGGFMWWWIFWHMFTDYHHIIGHFTLPEAGDWTDEELGVPPDSEE